MRVTQSFLAESFRFHLQRNSAGLLRIQEQVATQKRINRISDNAIDATRLLNVKRSKARLGQFIRNIERVTSVSNTYDTLLGQSEELIFRVKELLLSEANEITSTPQTRKSARLEVTSIITELLQIANTRFDGNFIFSGFEVDTAAFSSGTVAVTPGGGLNGAAASSATVRDLSQANFDKTYRIIFLDGAGNYEVRDGGGAGNVVHTGNAVTEPAVRFEGLQVVVTGGPPTATGFFDVAPAAPGVYQGDGGQQKIEIQSGSFVNQNLIGGEVFGAGGGGVDIFDIMNRVNIALRDNDRAALEDAAGLLSEVDRAREQLSSTRSMIGARQNLLDASIDRQYDIRLSLEILRSEIEDLDLTEAITRLNQQQIALEATLGAAAQITNLTLLDFLR